MSSAVVASPFTPMPDRSHMAATSAPNSHIDPTLRIADVADVRAREHRQEHGGRHHEVARGVADRRGVERQVAQQQVRREGTGADDHHVVDHLHRRDLEQPQPRLDDQEVEGGQEVEAPDQEPPESEGDGQRVGEGVDGLAGVERKLRERQHDEAHVEARREEQGHEAEQRQRHRPLDASSAPAEHDGRRGEQRDDDGGRQDGLQHVGAYGSRRPMDDGSAALHRSGSARSVVVRHC